MTTDQQMKAVADNATEGQWEERNDGPGEPNYVVHDSEYVIHIASLQSRQGADAQFIAASREWVPDAIRRLGIAAETIKLSNENTELYKARWRDAVARNDALEEQIGAVLDIFAPHLQAEARVRSKQRTPGGCICEICRATDVLKGES